MDSIVPNVVENNMKSSVISKNFMSVFHSLAKQVDLQAQNSQDLRRFSKSSAGGGFLPLMTK